jgi:hypothetical protein
VDGDRGPSHDDPASTVVQIVLSASSLRDRQESLSEADRRKVNAQAAGPDVLDSKQYPRIEFRSQRLEIDPGGSADHVRGRLHGTLTIRGRRVPTDVDIEADRGANEWRVRGKARLKQTEAGSSLQRVRRDRRREGRARGRARAEATARRALNGDLAELVSPRASSRRPSSERRDLQVTLVSSAGGLSAPRIRWAR